VHQDAKLIPLTLKSNDYVFEGEKLAAISASASKDSLGRTHISLVNIDAKKDQEITIDLKGAKFSSLSGRILSSAKLQDNNSFNNPDKIKPQAFKGASLKGNTLQVKMPPFSVVVLVLK
jgi:alpha-N-arabinofuranosidase